MAGRVTGGNARFAGGGYQDVPLTGARVIMIMQINPSAVCWPSG